MSSLNELLQNFVNKEYNELVQIGKDTLAQLIPVFQKVDEENDGMVMITALLLSAVGADGVLSAKETQYLKDVVGLDDEAIANLIKLYTSKSEDLVDKFFDMCPVELKSVLLTFILSLLAVDEKISREEVAFVKKLIDEQ